MVIIHVYHISFLNHCTVLMFFRKSSEQNSYNGQTDIRHIPVIQTGGSQRWPGRGD